MVIRKFQNPSYFGFQAKKDWSVQTAICDIVEIFQRDCMPVCLKKKPTNKQEENRGVLFSLEDFSFKIRFVSPPRDADSKLYQWKGLQPVALAAHRMSPYTHHQWQWQQWEMGHPTALLHQTAAHPTLRCPTCSSEAHTHPLQTYLLLQIRFPQGLFSLSQQHLCISSAATYHPGILFSLGEERQHLHLSLSVPYFSIWSLLKKFPMRTVRLLLPYIFILPFYTQRSTDPSCTTCSHLWPMLLSIFNYHLVYLLWLYAESLTLENTLHIALLSLRCWLDWLLSWPWGWDSIQRP